MGGYERPNRTARTRSERGGCMTTRARLFLMMVLQLAVWGAWAPKLFPYMGMLGFQPWQQSLVGSAWGLAAGAGVFFPHHFAGPQLARDRFRAARHLLRGHAAVACRVLALLVA